MNDQGLSREGLKVVACMTMLLDHIGATLILGWLMDLDGAAPIELFWVYYILRCIGRMAFPIFCFQLAEGAYYTKNPKKYALRLAIGALLAEIPFDLAFFGGISWEHSNVMVTLLLGFLMLEGMKRVDGFWKAAVIVPFYMAAELLHTDYAGKGILLIALFALTRGARHEKWLQLLGMLFLGSNAATMVNGVPIYMDRCKLLALLPIFAYDGRKVSQSKALQWGFYLFYPVHILVLYFLEQILF